MPAVSSQGWVIGRVGQAPVVVAPTSVVLGLIVAASWYPLVSSTLAGQGLLTIIGAVLGTLLAVSVSIALHELAHGLAGTLLGRRPVQYELYLWGGRTTFGPAADWRPWKDVVTSLAGPLANLLLWFAGSRVEHSGVILPDAAYVILWAVTWVNLALAIFNALPGLPLDGGHALAALVEQLSGSARAGVLTAAWGGVVVVLGCLWQWLVAPLVLHGSQPDALGLLVVLMVVWPIGQASWRVLGAGRRSRAADVLDLRALAQPVAVVPATERVREVAARLDGGAALALVVDGEALLGSIDAAGLAALGGADALLGATAGQACSAVPAAAVTEQLTGAPAQEALRRAREASRWLVLVDGGEVAGAVPTGAR